MLMLMLMLMLRRRPSRQDDLDVGGVGEVDGNQVDIDREAGLDEEMGV